MELEEAFLKTPFEGLSRSFRRSQKGVEKEITNVLKELNEMEKKGKSLTVQEAFDQLGQLSSKLQSLKRKLEEYKNDESIYLQKCKVRIEHLKSFSDINFKDMENEHTKRWHSIRMDRILVDYLLKMGFYETALLLSKKSNISELVDIEVFEHAKKIVDSLKRSDCKEALKWCSENRSKLRKHHSKLEFSLRMQEFIELVRADNYMEAIHYARTHFTPLLSSDLKEVQSVMVALAFEKTNYPKLFDNDRWNELISRFQKEYYQLFGITDLTLLDLNLQAGISVLKTSFCTEEESSKFDCPICTPEFRILAVDVPVAHHVHSTLICRISGKIMDDANPPLVLPNGNAYSTSSMQNMANLCEGRVTDPLTGEEFQYADLKRLYIS